MSRDRELGSQDDNRSDLEIAARAAEFFLRYSHNPHRRSRKKPVFAADRGLLLPCHRCYFGWWGHRFGVCFWSFYPRYPFKACEIRAAVASHRGTLPLFLL